MLKSPSHPMVGPRYTHDPSCNEVSQIAAYYDMSFFIEKNLIAA
jgi:hypothetical protein